MPIDESSASEPVLVMREPELAEEVSRLAAASGGELRRESRLRPASWREAPLVLVDLPTAEACLERGLPRRRGVVLLSKGPADQLWRVAFELAAERVLELPAAESELIELLADAGEPAGAGRVLAVLGGRGGAGASALATAVAVTEARAGRRSLLLDCDPLGGGLDLALGLEDVDGMRWSGLAMSSGRLGSTALIEALPKLRVGPGELALLACDRSEPPTGLAPDGVRAVLDAGRRSGALVVCDLPGGLSAPAETALREAELAVVVVPAEVRACAAAARLVAEAHERSGCPLRLVVRGPAPSGLRTADIAEAVGAPVLAAMRPQPGLPLAADRGGQLSALRRGPLARAAGEVLAELDAAPA
ncbi:septum site-determining protein Ssd [Saccharopolyspora griseoalba]|uniref:Septum site-determining protein Ssd n=1 Tax=Saccharopolyspora griseoalba TaxID=1431848 RepID=A0ABW2LEY8_9PSEU